MTYLLKAMLWVLVASSVTPWLLLVFFASNPSQGTIERVIEFARKATVGFVTTLLVCVLGSLLVTGLRAGLGQP